MAIEFQKIHGKDQISKKDIYYAKEKVTTFLTEEEFCRRAGKGSTIDEDEMRLALAKVCKGLAQVLKDGMGVELSIGRWKPTARLDRKRLGYGSVADPKDINATLLIGGCEFTEVKTLVAEVQNGCKFRSVSGIVEDTDTTPDTPTDTPTTPGAGQGNVMD